MSRRKRAPKESGGGGDWITTYSDLVTLLLCFFVLLFSMSAIDAGKFRQLMNGFQGGAGVLQGGTAIDMGQFDFITDEYDETELKELLEALTEYADTVGVGDMITVEVEERGIVIRFMDSVFFDSGSAEVKTGSFEMLNAVADLLNEEKLSSRQIKIEGHTDSDPIRYSKKYPTNWELSSARATNVLRYLIEVGNVDGGRLSSSGYSHYRPVKPNTTPENKAQNRRVDVVILKDEFQDLEP